MYCTRYGDVSFEESSEILCAERIRDARAKMFADGSWVSVEGLNALATPDKQYQTTSIGWINEVREHFHAICVALHFKHLFFFNVV